MGGADRGCPQKQATNIVIRAREEAERLTDMEDSSEKVHRLADTTFRVRSRAVPRQRSVGCREGEGGRSRDYLFLLLQNNEELSGELHRLVSAAKAYHKAMQSTQQ